jgi:molecular chaperone IbpA
MEITATFIPKKSEEIIDPFLFSWERHINTINTLKQVLPRSFPSYPPCNIIKKHSENEEWIIEMALAGFKKEDLEIVLKEGTLSIYTTFPETDPNEETLDRDESGRYVNYIHKGIAQRSFYREFNLAEDVKVVEVTLIDGMLRVYLQREIPEEKKSKVLEIKTPETIKQLNK